MKSNKRGNQVKAGQTRRFAPTKNRWSGINPDGKQADRDNGLNSVHPDFYPPQQHYCEG